MATMPESENPVRAASARLPITVAAAPPRGERLLFILAPYPAQAADVTRDASPITRATLGLVDALTFKRLTGHRAMYRDHYANARPLAYLQGMVAAAIEATGARADSKLLQDTAFAAQTGGDATPGAATESVDLRAIDGNRLTAMATDGGYAAVVLVWPDALGLGWERLERKLAPARNLFVLNGRRRLFELAPALRRKLALRRFCAYTRLPEIAFALATFPVAAICAFTDFIRRR